MSKKIENFTVLLVSPHTSQRSGLRKTLCDLGANNRNIEVAGDFTRARERLEKGVINLLITDDELSEREKGIDLLELHMQNNPETRSRIFILMTSQTTPFVMSDFVLKGGDCLINKPFRNETLIKSISGILSERQSIRAEEALTLDVQDALRMNDFKKAQDIISKFKNPDCLEASYSKAVTHEASQEWDQAFALYSKVIDEKPNFKSLVSILKIGMISKKYFELSDYLDLWLKKYPIHHNSITDMTKAIVINRKYPLLDELFQLFSLHRIHDDFAKASLAAGFAIAATLSHEKGETNKAKLFSLKGLEYAGRRQQIVIRAVDILQQLGEGPTAEKAYYKFSGGDDSVEGKLLDLKVMEILHPKLHVLKECQKLMSENIVDPELFRITISCLKSMGKQPDDIIALAKKKFPHKTF